MAEKVGSVYIDASIDTTGVIHAGKAIAKVTDGIRQDFAGVGNAANSINTNMTKTAAAVENAGRSMRGVSGIAGQLGFQLQDIAVQAQSGTSAFVILGQQGSQIASAFGPGGAVFGAVLAIAAAIGGTLVASIKKAEAEVEKLPEGVQKRIEEIGKKFENVDFSNRADLARSELGKLNVEYDKTQETINRLAAELKDLDTFGPSSKFVTGGQQYTKVWSETNGKLKKARMEMADLKIVIDKVNDTASSGLGGKSLDDLQQGLTDGKTNAQALAAQIQAATLRLTEGELVARKYAAAQALGLTNAEMLPPEIALAIEQLYKLEQAEKAALAQKKEALATQRQIKEEIQAEAAEELKALQLKRKGEEDQKKKVTTEFTSVQTSIRGDLETPAQQADRELAERLAVIGRYAEQEQLTREQARSLELQAEAAHQKRITDIAEEEKERRKGQNMDTARSAADTFGILADIAKEGGKKSFKQWKIFASAQAAISAALAVSNALTLPPPLSFIAAGAVAAASAIQIAKINSTQYSGKLYGGAVQAGGMYPVTEDGRPEILKQGNRQYLLPGSQGGEVISNKDMQQVGGTGGGGITITYSPTIYAQQTDFETIMAGQPEAVLNAVRAGLASEGRTL